MRERTLGDILVGSIGLGTMPLSIEGRPDKARAIATVHAALDAGVTLLDTADSYHRPGAEPGHNELLVARALAGRREDVLVATKGGRGRPADGSWTVNGDPAHLQRACEASLRRLGVEAIGLYQLHKPDPAVPWAESVGALRDLLDAGKIQRAGVSNADVPQVREAYEILGGRLVSVQNEYSPTERGSEAVLRLCEELRLAFLPWSPLGGIGNTGSLGAAFEAIAERRGVGPQRVALAWHLAGSPVSIPIPGSSRPSTIRDSAAAAEFTLDAEERALLDAG
ncbi:aldo/keto reductase [Streptomyces sp. 21So2-11]|uniref:aldo/keto reductase n=1 Tax=Streptomyces sp. 21So2-11 TaxID=3144408 RepID=UPI00321B044B